MTSIKPSYAGAASRSYSRRLAGTRFDVNEATFNLINYKNLDRTTTIYLILDPAGMPYNHVGIANAIHHEGFEDHLESFGITQDNWVWELNFNTPDSKRVFKQLEKIEVNEFSGDIH